MDAFDFVKKLVNLDLKGCQNLKTSDFEWIFQQNSSDSFFSFWTFFFEEYQACDLLSEDEITQYNELKTADAVLSSEYIDKITSYIVLDDIDTRSASTPFSNSFNLHLDSEVEEAHSEIARLNARQKHLRLEILECQSQLSQREASIDTLKNKIEGQKLNTEACCEDYLSAVKGISSRLEQTMNFVKRFETSELPYFFSQMSLTELWNDSVKFDEALDQHCYNNSFEKESHLDHLSDNSAAGSNIIGSSAMDCYVGSKSVAANSSELRRLTLLLEEEELFSIDCELQKLSKDEQIRCALAFLGKVKRNQFGSLPEIMQEIESKTKVAEALEQDVEFQRKCLEKHAVFVAQENQFKTLIFDYDNRLEFKSLFDSEYNFVKNLLLNQLSRLDLIKLVYDADQSRIRRILDVVGQLCNSLAHEFKSSSSRLTQLSRLKQVHENEDIIAGLSDGVISILREFLRIDEGRRKSECFKEAIKTLWMSAELFRRTFDKELRVALDSEIANLNYLYNCKSTLEDCLFKDGKKTTSLVSSINSSDLAERNSLVEKKMIGLQENLLSIISKYEHKIKVLKENPSMNAELVRWTQSLT